MKTRQISIDYFLILLTTISVVVCALNYSQNTYLSGWDSLHPEFNLSLYWNRITSVWQQHQGLGAPPSQSHASEIPRMAIVALLTALVPQSFVRYGYIYIMMIIGPIGVFLLLRQLLNNLNKSAENISSLSAFLGGLYYLLNYGTIQQFIAPFEMFATKYGYLGFIFFFAIQYLKTDLKKYLWSFIAVILLSSAMAHTATLWYVFYFGFALYLISYYIFTRQSGKKIAVILILTLALNCFWILPNIYYTFTHSNDVILSKIHRLSSEETYKSNKNSGNIKSYLQMKGYLTEWNIISNDFHSIKLLNIWEKHFSQKTPQLLMYTFSIMSFFGLGVLIIKSKSQKMIAAFIPSFLFSSFFLLSDIPVISSCLEFIRNNSPIIKEIIRSPYTKFSIYDIFFRTIFFAYFHFIFLLWLQKKISIIKTIHLTQIYYLLITLCILYYSLPSFQGQFINPLFRVKIPADYLKLFQWANAHDHNVRMLELPLQSIYGWNYHEWNSDKTSTIYQGAGFLWFGLPQPLLDREFDRWSQPNEQAYRELAYAINSQNNFLFEKTLQKYNIGYILYDKSHFNPNDSFEKKQQKDKIDSQWLEEKPYLQKTETFGSIQIFKNINVLINESFSPIVVGANQIPEIYPPYIANYYDSAYVGLGDYFTRNIPSQSAYYIPGRQLLNQTERIDTSNISNKNGDLVLKNNSKDVIYNYESANITTPILDNFLVEGKFTLLKNLTHYQGIYSYSAPLLKTNVSNTSFDLGSINEIGLVELNKKIIPISDETINAAQNVNISEPEIEVNTFSSKPLPNTSFTIQLDHFFLCSKSAENADFGALQSDRDIKIYGNNGDICADVLVHNTTPNNQVNALSFILQTEKSLDYCLYNINDNNCLAFEPLQNGQNTIYFKSSSDNTKKMRFKLHADEKNIPTLSTLSEFKLASYSEISNYMYKLDLNIPLQNAQSKQNLVFPLTSVQTVFDVSNSIDRSLDCGKQPAQVLKRMQNNVQNYVEYRVTNGTICESISLDSMKNDVSHLLIVRSKYLSGLPLRFCLLNSRSNTCLLDDELSNNPKFNNDYFIIPKYSNLQDIKLSIRLNAIGDTSSVQLQNIYLIPFPYEKTQSIALSNVLIPYKKYSEKMPIYISNFTHPTQWLYALPTSNLPKDVTLIIDQAFEKNWVGFASNMEPNNPLLDLVIPLFSYNYNKFHVLTNNWSNGWINNNDNLKSNAYLYIVYMPQYYLFVGFAIFAGVIIFISVHNIKKK